MNQEDKRRLKKIKSSIFERTLSLTKFTLGTSTKVLGHNLSTLFDETDLKSEKWKKLLSESALNLSQELGELKGSLMKAGQMISMYGEIFLPPEANEFLKTLQSKSPPLDFSVIQKILQDQYQERLSQLKIDENPIGAASMGQVHRARINGAGNAANLSATMALKIQYPGVESAISSDLKSLRTLLSVLKLLPSDFQANVLFDEVESMLRQELDYELEKKSTQVYGKKLENDPRYIVPRIFEDWCTEKIIATSFEAGLPVDHPLVLGLPQERRNQIAEAYLDLYFKEIFDWSLVQTDPHLGNYKIRLADPKDSESKDQLILLDFGAVRTYSDGFLIPYRKMIQASIERDLQKLTEASLELQFIQKEDPPALKKHFQDFCLLTVEPFISREISGSEFMSPEGIYDWKRSDLPKRLTAIGMKIIKEFPLRSPPPEIVFLDRKTGGVFIFLSVLGARINSQKMIQKYFVG